MKICIAHFRVGLTDGVSLQIEERERILKQFGHQVYFISGTKSPVGDLKIGEFDYKLNKDIVELQKKAFSSRDGIDLESKVKLQNLAKIIEARIEDFWDRKKFTLIFVHNIFSLPVCLPATIAFYNFLLKHPQIKAVGVHHDFYWDPPRITSFYPKDAYTRSLLRKYFPAKLPNLSHTVLSKWEKHRLFKLKKLDSEVVTDTFDFEQAQWSKNPSNSKYLKDIGLTGNEIILLLASRIRPRKGIELGIEFTAVLTKSTNREVVLVLPNDYSKKEYQYIRKLKNLARKEGVRILWIQDLVGSDEEKRKGLKKYSLWDTYVYSDAILYPSLWEGFGNQFLEAVFAKKPIVSFEYPVFKTDVKPAGFEIFGISENVVFSKNGLAIGDIDNFQKIAFDLLNLIGDKRRLSKIVNKNFAIGRKRFNTKTQLRKYLHIESEKFLKVNGTKDVISPLLLSGKLISSGISFRDGYELAESIVSDVPKKGMKPHEFFELIINRLPKENKIRYVTIELVKEFLLSKKSNSPLFIFLGGLAGKSTMANFIQSHLSINQPIAFDKEKYNIADPSSSKPYLWKATYESSEGYVKTIEELYPYLLKLVERLQFDYSRYKKWCYFTEGIYLSAGILKNLTEKHPEIYHLSVFNLPSFSDIKKRYILRWQDELGAEKLKKNRNVIDSYLKNVKAIRAHIGRDANKIASFVIESPILEESLLIFYVILFQKLKDIADQEIPGWIEKVLKRPKKILAFDKYLKS